MRTVCKGGALEPLYRPSADGGGLHVLHYRADYAASALHEIAHWCIAGAQRRTLTDFGYQYVPPPRSPAAQQRFLDAECRTQALEAVFAERAGVSFQVSIDNFPVPDMAAEFDRQRDVFEARVRQSTVSTQTWLRTIAGNRALRFITALERAGER